MIIKAVIQEFLADNYFHGKRESLGDDNLLLVEGILDSQGVLQLIAFMEETFGIDVQAEEIEPAVFETVGSLAAYVRTKLSDVSA